MIGGKDIIIVSTGSIVSDAIDIAHKLEKRYK